MAAAIGQQGQQAASAEGPWQRTMLMASQYIAMDENFVKLLDNEEAIELFGPIDNSSHQCSGWYTNNGDCVPCPDDKPLWWLVLRWLKLMLLKIARSYHAKPLLLMIAPLCAGLLLGYCLGVRRAPRTRTGAQRLASKTAPKSFFRLHRSGSSIRQSLLTICFKVMAYLSEDVSPPTGHEEEKLESRLEARGNDSQVEKSAAKTTHADDDTLLPPTVDDAPLESREDYVRTDLKSDNGCIKESGVEKSQVPRHIAVIMDGNRRYGKQRYGSSSRGHWDGCSKLVEFSKWCIAEEISVLTVYAFSTENWNRDPLEVASLMTIFAKYCDELRVEALKRNIKILVLATDMSRIPDHVKAGLTRMVDETSSCHGGLTMNICMSYGSRSEIVNASRSLALDAADGKLDPLRIDERGFSERLLTNHCGDPDVLLRTSGEFRISNFLLWQLAYSEMFFIDKPWPSVEKDDLLQVIRTYATGRLRRFGK